MHCDHKNDNFTSIWLPQGRIVDLEEMRKHEAREKLSDGPFPSLGWKIKNCQIPACHHQLKHQVQDLLQALRCLWKHINQYPTVTIFRNGCRILFVPTISNCFYKTEPSLPLAAPAAVPPARNGERGPEKTNSHQQESILWSGPWGVSLFGNARCYENDLGWHWFDWHLAFLNRAWFEHDLFWLKYIAPCCWHWCDFSAHLLHVNMPQPAQG